MPRREVRMTVRLVRRRGVARASARDAEPVARSLVQRRGAGTADVRAVPLPVRPTHPRVPAARNAGRGGPGPHPGRHEGRGRRDPRRGAAPAADRRRAERRHAAGRPGAGQPGSHGPDPAGRAAVRLLQRADADDPRAACGLWPRGWPRRGRRSRRRRPGSGRRPTAARWRSRAARSRKPSSFARS